MRRGAVNDEPITRLGNCCGCSQFTLLFKITGLFRYRCGPCYEREVGTRHWLDTVRIVEKEEKGG